MGGESSRARGREVDKYGKEGSVIWLALAGCAFSLMQTGLVVSERNDMHICLGMQVHLWVNRPSGHYSVAFNQGSSLSLTLPASVLWHVLKDFRSCMKCWLGLLLLWEPSSGRVDSTNVH